MPRSLGFYYEVNYDLDGYVGMDDWGILGTGLVGPALPKPPDGSATIRNTTRSPDARQMESAG